MFVGLWVRAPQQGYQSWKLTLALNGLRSKAMEKKKIYSNDSIDEIRMSLSSNAIFSIHCHWFCLRVNILTGPHDLVIIDDRQETNQSEWRHFSARALSGNRGVGSKEGDRLKYLVYSYIASDSWEVQLLTVGLAGARPNKNLWLHSESKLLQYLISYVWSFLYKQCTSSLPLFQRNTNKQTIVCWNSFGQQCPSSVTWPPVGPQNLTWPYIILMKTSGHFGMFGCGIHVDVVMVWSFEARSTSAPRLGCFPPHKRNAFSG